MLRNVVIIGASLLFGSSAHALDLQREELLNLYHGVESEQAHPAQEWVNLSTGIASNYQGNEQDHIKFAPLPESKTEIGVFTSDSLTEDLSSNEYGYEFESPAQFGHNESESYGVYIKQSF